MSTGFRFEGLEELKRDLRNLPAELTAEASRIVEGAANGSVAEMKAGYPDGDLRDRVTMTPSSSGRFGVGIEIKNTNPLASLWDQGSQARHYITKRGAIHETGKMWGRRPPPFTFIRAMIKARRLMYSQLKDLLIRKGLTVTGDGR